MLDKNIEPQSAADAGSDTPSANPIELCTEPDRSLYFLDQSNTPQEQYKEFAAEIEDQHGNRFLNLVESLWRQELQSDLISPEQILKSGWSIGDLEAVLRYRKEKRLVTTASHRLTRDLVNTWLGSYSECASLQSISTADDLKEFAHERLQEMHEELWEGDFSPCTTNTLAMLLEHAMEHCDFAAEIDTVLDAD